MALTLLGLIMINLEIFNRVIIKFFVYWVVKYIFLN